MTGKFDIKKNRYELFVAIFILWPNLLCVIPGITRNFINIGKLDTGLLYLGLITLFVCVSRQFVSRFKPWMLISALIVLYVVFLSSLVSPDTSVNFKAMQKILVSCLPVFLFAGCVRNGSALYSYMVEISRFIPLLGLIIVVFFPSSAIEEKGYSQSMSYLYLLPAMLLMSDCFGKFTIKSFLPLICAVVVILSYGARGPFVSLLIMMVVFFVFNSSSLKKTALFAIVIGAVTLLVSHYWNIIILAMFNAFSDLGFSVRVLSKMMEENLMQDDGRNALASGGMQYILEHPLMGAFPINDRFVCASAVGNSDVYGNYPHNIIIEVFMQFGFLIGTFLLLAYGWLVFYGIKNAKSGALKKLLLVFWGVSFLPLLFSGSYWEDRFLYISVSLLVLSVKGQLSDETKRLSHSNFKLVVKD